MVTVSEMLARNARTYPDGIALIERIASQNLRKQITWEEFDDRANHVANLLIDRGVKKGDKVILLMMNSINWLEVYFGIIRTGAWVVPLNYRFTAQEIKYCIDIAEAKTLIFDENFTTRVVSIRPELSIDNYFFVGQNTPSDTENLENAINYSYNHEPDVEFRDEDPCGLYFTSGTTGKPKPILLTHKNMEHAGITENKHHSQTVEDNFILIPPLYHTGAKMHWFGSLIVGGRATLLNGVTPKSILEAVSEEKGTIVFLLVPWVQDLLGALDRGEAKLKDYDLKQWRLMHMGAQPIPPSLIKRWRHYFPEMQYDTSYGLSEATGPGAIDLRIENIDKIEALGKAGFNWEVRIVDDKGCDVRQGEIGEITLRGNGVMKEYYKNPEKTAETIRDGWLFTGDMAQIREDGFIYLAGRKKDLIISGGENIYPHEVEEVIRRHPKVFDVAVMGMPDERLGECAVAIIDPKPGQTINEAEMKAFYEQSLPRYKQPRRTILDKVPRNPTGKIEKAKLREKYGSSEIGFFK